MQHQHLECVITDDEDTKQELPIHVVLGASEYAKLKTSTVPRVGKPGASSRGHTFWLDHYVPMSRAQSE